MVVARTVKVGHDPLRVRADGPKKTVRLTFRGKEGQFLNLALWAKGGGSSFPRPPCASWELRRNNVVIKPWGPGYWKVPRTGTYVASVEPCKRLTGRVRLRKVVVTDAVLDGSITQVGERRDVTHLVKVGVPAGEVVTYVGGGPSQLPADGTYQMSAYVQGSTGSDEFGLRVRAAVAADALTVDGPAVTYAATSPGQWVIGTIPEAATSSTVATASNVSPTLSDWRVTAVTGFPNPCGPESGQGCPDYYYSDLTPADLTQPLASDYNIGPRLALLSVPPNVQGSLDLRLTSS